MYRHLTMLIFFMLAVAAVAFPQDPVRFTAEIPRPPASMSLYKLAATRAPVDFFNEKLAKAKLPGLKLDKQYYVVRSGDNKEPVSWVTRCSVAAIVFSVTLSFSPGSSVTTRPTFRWWNGCRVSGEPA